MGGSESWGDDVKIASVLDRDARHEGVEEVTNPIRMTVYRWAGRKWFFRVRSECAECDLAVGQVRALVSAHPDWPLEVEVKPWLADVWESLRHGGWHAPVVLVDGHLLSQGKVPTCAELEAAARQAFVRRRISLSRPWQQEKRQHANSEGTSGRG